MTRTDVAKLYDLLENVIQELGHMRASLGRIQRNLESINCLILPLISEEEESHQEDHLP